MLTFPLISNIIYIPSLGVKVQSDAHYSSKNNFPLIRLAGGYPLKPLAHLGYKICMLKTLPKPTFLAHRYIKAWVSCFLPQKQTNFTHPYFSTAWNKGKLSCI